MTSRSHFRRKKSDEILDEINNFFSDLRAKDDKVNSFLFNLSHHADKSGALFIIFSQLLPFDKKLAKKVYNKLIKLNDSFSLLAQSSLKLWNKGIKKYNYDTNKFYLVDDKEK